MQYVIQDLVHAAVLVVRMLLGTALGTVLATVSVAGVTDEWPKISGQTTGRECVDAQRLAYGVFHSRTPRLYAPLAIPDGMESRMVLGALALDISGGRALSADTAQFDEVPQLGQDSNRRVFWGKPLELGVRLVVAESDMGWRGDLYALYVLDTSVEQPTFLADLPHRYDTDARPPLIGGAWRPPLVFQFNAGGGSPWFVTVGEPYEVLGAWSVYRAVPGGYAAHCTIAFHPAGVAGAALLPAPVQEFVRLLDATLGPGQGEGTLQATAGLRMSVEHLWGNAALRPWALSEADVYNSREEVDRGLKSWARGAASFKAVHAQIQQSYPRAERSLQRHYERQFSLPPAQAARLARWVMDLGYRANFKFSNGGDYFRYDGVNTNPWRQL